jgi:uncharacterized membrane protein YfcA
VITEIMANSAESLKPNDPATEWVEVYNASGQTVNLRGVQIANRFGALAGSVLGFYDGFFGPGAGAFWTAACVHLRGMGLPRATAFTKVVNLTSNLAALAVFASWGQVDPASAGAMIVGQAVGGRIGAGLAVKHGAPFIRIVFAGVVFTLVARLLWQTLAG